MRDDKFQTAVKVGDYDFRIHNIDALHGTAIIMFVAKKVLPLLKSLNIDFEAFLKEDTNTAMGQIADAIAPVLNSISPEELTDVMETCLKQVDILMPAGYVKLYAGGEFAVPEIKYSMKTCFALCYHVIKPVITDFFGESGLSMLKAFNPTTNQ